MKKHNRSIMYALVLIMLMLSFLSSNELNINTVKYYYAYYFSDYKQIFSALNEKFKLDIIYNVEKKFLNEITLDPSLENRAQQMSDFELTRYSVLLPDFFSKYPKSIIQDELQMIKLADSLILFGMIYGGTSVGSTIYLTSSGYDKGFTDAYIEETFHHEFSSILMRNHKFPQVAWQACNLAEFKYAQSESEIRRAIKDGNDAIERNEIYYSKGFLTKYAMSTMENDLNIMAEHVFTHPNRLKLLIQQYPIIMKKYKLFRAFYLGINSEFISVFEKID